ncbi:hypothetical protein BT96DRAFT_912394 [Gymnopus androsaceus JB14]|uniref:Uncharacterized protein n=1 Tax=Gymnopus androsaceus JB14 TaxID=1447944 RepID=A0A6A4IQL4_9AGAR|nr:hypothetical protein BT96DRAFT_912394 [Gymnopus androsaceus JB14]
MYSTDYLEESPTSSFSSSPMAQADDYGLGFVWNTHYQQALNLRGLDAGGYCEDQWQPTYQAWDRSQARSYMHETHETQHVPEMTDACDLPLHAPIPVSGHSSILFTDIESSNWSASSPTSNHSFSSPIRNTIAAADVHAPRAIIAPPQIHEPRPMSPTAPPQPMHTFMNTFSVRAPVQTTFPTPCELLNEINGGGSNSNGASPESTSDSSPMETSGSSSRRHDAALTRFSSPEPEVITSHEKKRQYLECLEHYVQYLHDQINRIGVQAVPIERVSTYRGLSSRSIRTLLVHMETSTAKLKDKTHAEEQRFITLRDAYLRQEGSPTDPYIAASVETGEYYSNSAHPHNHPSTSAAGSYRHNERFNGLDLSHSSHSSVSNVLSHYNTL